MLTVQERKDFSVPNLADKKPKYPYGLRIRLSSEELNKLGLKDIAVDQVINFEASAMIISITQEESEGDEKGKSVELQITDMYLEKEDENTVSMIYGE